ncbi:hypothetical protein KKD52_03865 [Myxococcota bacterium]|nr:hypothetical protein [Myxococcota bacterium]MBU1410677.1 hypothetical protein [Myxococcota bacterium]MBU1509477.1 hypothetical protein [Myxococcota bacterium]
MIRPPDRHPEFKSAETALLGSSAEAAVPGTSAWTADGSSAGLVDLPMHRQLWIFLLCVLLSSALWMDALHHHDDFSRDKPDCMLCQIAGSAALEHPPWVNVQQFFQLIILQPPAQPDYTSLISSCVLRNSPKTGPPVLSHTDR